MKQGKSQNPSQGTPLIVPTQTLRYPFKNHCEHFIKGSGDYLLQEEAIEILEKTVGLPANKSSLKAFLAKECNIPDPTNYSFPNIIAALKLYLDRKIKDTKKKGNSNANNNELLAERQLEVWDLLKGNCLSAKELGKSMGLLAENVRKHIQAVRKKFGTNSIENTRSRGYWRPDAPPKDSSLQPST